MLIPLHSLVEKYNIKFKGLLHVGAHECEEINEYEKYLSRDKILWIEAMPEKVDFSKLKYPNILIENAVVSNVVEKVKFNISNNSVSSSILEFGLHSYFHPDVNYVNSFETETKLLKDIICNYDIEYNFLNLDVQGAELKALKGMEKYLNSVDYIYTEVNSDYVYKDCALITELDEYLLKFGLHRVETQWYHNFRWGDAFYIRKNSEKRVFFQIGTNDGNDLFRDIVKEKKPDTVILVEPNITLIDKIKYNYSSIKNVHIYNNAVYYNNDENLELYIPAKKGIMGTKADNNITYSDVHFSLLPMNDWGHKDDMVKIIAKSITFDEICKNHDITNIEYLQIDTEGFDSEILQMIDLNRYKINKRRFEKWEFPVERFTNYHDKLANELGINGMNNVINKLKKHNYIISEINDKDGNDIIATLM